MTEIPLTQGKVAIVDDEDYEAISAFKWGFSARGYATRTSSERQPKCKHYSMHRVVFGVTDPKLLVDHINGDRLDNRKSNLRICSNAENLQNRGPQKNNSSGYKGVMWKKSTQKWVAQIKLNNKRYQIGTFPTAESAHEAYKAAAVSKMHGAFANFGEKENDQRS